MPGESYSRKVDENLWTWSPGSWRYPASETWAFGTAGSPTDCTAARGAAAFDAQRVHTVVGPALPWDARAARPKEKEVAVRDGVEIREPPRQSPPPPMTTDEEPPLEPMDEKTAVAMARRARSYFWASAVVAGGALLFASSRPGYIHLGASVGAGVIWMFGFEALSCARRFPEWESRGIPPLFGHREYPSIHELRRSADRLCGAAFALVLVALWKWGEFSVQ